MEMFKEKITEIINRLVIKHAYSSDEAIEDILEAHNQVLRQTLVSGRSEQFVCGANRVMGEKRCERQCGQCEELYPQINCC